MDRLQNNPSIGWAHSKSTHARPLTWGQLKKIETGIRGSFEE
jgi:hypothetical protein